MPCGVQAFLYSAAGAVCLRQDKPLSARTKAPPTSHPVHHRGAPEPWQCRQGREKERTPRGRAPMLQADALSTWSAHHQCQHLHLSPYCVLLCTIVYLLCIYCAHNALTKKVLGIIAKIRKYPPIVRCVGAYCVYCERRQEIPFFNNSFFRQ